MKLAEEIERAKVTLVYWIIVTMYLGLMTVTYRGLIVGMMVAGVLMLREEWNLEHLEEAKQKRNK